MNYSGYFTDKNGNKYFPISNPKFTGTRNRYYLVGRQTHSGSSSDTAGQFSAFISNMDYYDSGVPGFINVDREGKIAVSTIFTWNLSSFKKNFYVYKDQTYDYVFIQSPNYNDKWFIEVLVRLNFSISWQGYSETEFQNYVRDMTLVSSA